MTRTKSKEKETAASSQIRQHLQVYKKGKPLASVSEQQDNGEVSFSRASNLRDDFHDGEEDAEKTPAGGGYTTKAQNMTMSSFNVAGTSAMSNIAKKKSKPGMVVEEQSDGRNTVSRNNSRKKFPKKSVAGTITTGTQQVQQEQGDDAFGERTLNEPLQGGELGGGMPGPGDQTTPNLYQSSSQLPLIITKYTTEGRERGQPTTLLAVHLLIPA